MNEQKTIDYQRIEKAIHYIKQNFKAQPSLDEIAAEINLSSFHFQRLFHQWAGISPKKFMQYLSLEYAKSLLKAPENTLFDITFETGLSSTSRLHDLFVNIEGMTPKEYQNGGQNLKIEYFITDTLFGKIIIGSTQKGICHTSFIKDEILGVKDLKNRFSKANFIENKNHFHQQIIDFFNQNINLSKPIQLHLCGTHFQIKIWESLLKIPTGKLTTYGEIAKSIEKPKASRAVGTAIGANPVALLIPCHRVIQSSGKLGGYMWGENRKSAIIGWEAAQQHKEI